MKTSIFSLILFMLLGCAASKKKAVSNIDVSDPKFRLHDIWAAEAIEGQVIDADDIGKGQERPRLELYVAEMRLYGTDGCNEVFGLISQVDEKQLTFDKIVSTRELCQNRIISDGFLKALKSSTHYQIKNLRLHLFDGEGREVLRLRKID